MLPPVSVIRGEANINPLPPGARVIVLLLVSIEFVPSAVITAEVDTMPKPERTPVPFTAIGPAMVVFPVLLMDNPPPVVIEPRVSVVEVLPNDTAPVSTAEKLATAFDV
jgi:hypothetical protein